MASTRRGSFSVGNCSEASRSRSVASECILAAILESSKTQRLDESNAVFQNLHSRSGVAKPALLYVLYVWFYVQMHTSSSVAKPAF